MNKLKEKYYIALGNLQGMAIDNTKGSKGVDICVLDINGYIEYLQSKIDKAIEYIEKSMNNPQPWHEYLFGDEDGKVENLDKLLDILKEDK